MWIYWRQCKAFLWDLHEEMAQPNGSQPKLGMAIPKARLDPIQHMHLLIKGRSCVFPKHERGSWGCLLHNVAQNSGWDRLLVVFLSLSRQVKSLLGSFQMCFQQGDTTLPSTSKESYPTTSKPAVHQTWEKRTDCLSCCGGNKKTHGRLQEDLALSFCMNLSWSICPSTVVTLLGLWEYCGLQKCLFWWQKHCVNSLLLLKKYGCYFPKALEKKFQWEWCPQDT